MKFKIFIILTSIIVTSAKAQADKLDGDGILRKDDGSMRLLIWEDAMKACPPGTRLPSIREQAKEVQVRGGKGILELWQVKEVPPDGYYKISAFNPDGSKDEFYFNHDGYQRPSGDLGSNNWFWTSSVNYYSSPHFDFVYSVDAKYGFLPEHGKYGFDPVRCVAN